MEPIPHQQQGEPPSLILLFNPNLSNRRKGKKKMMVERHYTTGELGKMWHVDRKTVHAWFEDEPGVLKFGTSTSTRIGRKLVRSYLSIRIPESIAAKVYARKTA